VNDEPTKTDFIRRFNLQFKELERKGQSEKVPGRGRAARWRLKPPV
jgi:hypothetical protein